jgi:hypothetical protein
LGKKVSKIIAGRKNLFFPPFSFDLFANEAKEKNRKERKEDTKYTSLLCPLFKI